ncbi:MAG: hypothetical protein O7G13_08055, partial [Alphaproteobacteria bacterium]|nr:hypothetical protein [Alphaproteobacteria bacterium]
MQFQQDRAAGLFGYILAEQLHALMDESHRPARLDPAGIGGVTGDRHLAPKVVPGRHLEGNVSR